MECGDRHLSEYTTLVVHLGISDKSLGYLFLLEGKSLELVLCMQA